MKMIFTFLFLSFSFNSLALEVGEFITYDYKQLGGYIQTVTESIVKVDEDLKCILQIIEI